MITAAVSGSRLSVFFLLLLFAVCSHSAPVLIIDDSFQGDKLENWLDILDNPDSTITAGNILQPQHLNQFAPLPVYAPGAMSHYSRYVWLRFSVYNDHDEPQILWFSGYRRLENRIHLYRLQQDAMVHLQDAALFQAGQTPMLKEMVLAAHEKAVFFVQIDGLPLHLLHLNLARPSVFFQRSLIEGQQFSFGIGILLASSLLCVVLGIFFQAPLFLWQSLYVFAAAVVLMLGMDIPAGWGENLSEGQYLAAFAAMAIAAIAALLAVIEYLRMLRISRVFRRRLQAIAVACGLGFAVLLFSGRSYSPVLLLLFLTLSSSILVACFYGWLKTRSRLALAVTLVRGVNALVIMYMLSRQTWLFVQLLEPIILYCLVVETLLLVPLHFADVCHRTFARIRQQHLLQQGNEKDRIRSEVLEDISHDIRTPLSAVIGMAGLLQQGALSQSQQEKVASINQSAQEMLSCLAAMQARISTDDASTEIRQIPFELSPLIDACIQGFQIQAERQQLELIIHLAPDIPEVVRGDAAKLQKILINLLAYLMRYAAQGEIVLHVSRPAAPQHMLLFSLGSTVDDEAKADVAADAGELAMVNQLLESMGSSLQTLQRNEKRECRFALELPPLKTAVETDNADDILRKKKVLVVDDNHTWCKVLKQQLSSWGMQVAEAYDGDQAIAMCRAARNLANAFDILIIDFDMPYLSGMDVAARISADSTDAPLMIMLTGAGMAPPEPDVRTAGIAAILHKPASAKLIRLTLSNLLHMRATSHIPSGGSEQYRILVAEDNDVSRRVISKMLDSIVVQYKLVSNGQLALQAVQRENFDLIFMDCEMPLMDGFEASRQIHQWQRESDKPQTPIVALTAHTLGNYQQRCRDAGMVDFLSKPIQLATLQGMIFRYGKRS